jgi:hypothetical protein
MKKSNSKNQKNVQTLNFKNLISKVSKVEISEKKERQDLYIYDEKKFKTEKDRNSREGKKFRASCRRQLDRFANEIVMLVKYNRTPELPEKIEAFKKFYKTNYRVNDFSVNSISQREDVKNEVVKLMFEIIISFDAQTKKEKPVRTKKIKEVTTEVTPTENITE